MGCTRFSHDPLRKAAIASHVQPPRIATDAAAAPVNGRKAASSPIAIAVTPRDATRDAVDAGRMNRFARMLSAMLACNWMPGIRSEEHTSELQSRGLISYAVFCLKKK